MTLKTRARDLFWKFPRPIVRLCGRVIYWLFPGFLSSQNNEDDIIKSLLQGHECFFFEFGFGPTEFNCIRLSMEGSVGVIADVDAEVCSRARKLLPASTWVLNQKMNPASFRETYLEFRGSVVRDFGLIPSIISIDVDSIDYEFFIEALDLGPDIIICEFNISLGVASKKVPFSLNHDRRRFGNSLFYGASLFALYKAAHQQGYCLAGIDENKVNSVWWKGSEERHEECHEHVKQFILTIEHNHRTKRTSMSVQAQGLETDELPFLEV
jgi:hypothetical protein